MRIIDCRHDYYDCIQAQGQDLSLIYVRAEKIINIDKSGFPFHIFDYSSGKLTAITHNIGFCGNVYPVLQIPRYSSCNKLTFCYNVEDVDNFVDANYKNDEIAGYHANRNQHGRQFDWPFSSRRYEVVKFFDDAKKASGIYKKWFDAEKSPIFVATRESHNKSIITYNALLRQYNFFRLFDPPSAFQELQMYMGNMAMPDRPIPKLLEEDMAHSKGHGDKYSFRTAPGTKPKRKNI